MQKAIFLDRDGVINIEKEYLYKIEEFEFCHGVIDSLRYLQTLGYQLFIITNQSGISRGYYTTEDFHTLTQWMLQRLKKEGIVIEDVQFCPHSPKDNCSCRKPKIGMIQNITNKYDIDLHSSWLIGDKDSDILCAHNAGITQTIQVKSGHDFNEKESKASFIMDDLSQIKAIIHS